MEADFSGYATKNGLKCSDGRTIMTDAFKHNDRQRVPLVWQHQHNNTDNILGHAILENRADGVYCRGFFNDTESGQTAKQLVKHGDVEALSIYANNLKQQGKNVLHGNIREVSLVLSGANPGAFIDNVNLVHDGISEVLEDEFVLYTGLSLEHEDKGDAEEAAEVDDPELLKTILESLNEEQAAVVHGLLEDALAHSDAEEAAEVDDPELLKTILESLNEEQAAVVHGLLEDALAHSDTKGVAEMAANTQTTNTSGASGDETIKDVLDTLTPKQMSVVEFLIGDVLEGDSTNSGDTAQHYNINEDEEDALAHSTKKGFENMSRNTFENNGVAATAGITLSHSQIATIFADAQNNTHSFKKSTLAHANDFGITNIELLFPDAKTIANAPELLSRRMEWVSSVLTGTKHSPFAKVKSLTADITADEARAKGYIKGKLKKDEVVKMLRRTTSPTTVYKKQKLDRDDILDITDLDVVAWLKAEIRIMLEEEIARAILFGDGRDSLSDDKVKDPEGATDGTGIRSILHDHDLYSVKFDLAANVSPKDAVKGMVRARSKYRGTGKPTLFISDAFLTDIMLEEDKFGRALYETEQVLADKLRVSSIITVDVIDDTENLLAIMVNLADYTIGANKGGELTSFEDFDIDYNQNKYLTETRISGSLTKPYSAVVIRRLVGTKAVPTAPAFDTSSNKITIPTVTGVVYEIDDVAKTGQVTITEDTEVVALPAEGYYFEANSTKSWNFTYTAG